MLTKILCAIVAGGTILLAFTTTEEQRGRDLFARRCSGCHAMDANREGPRLRGVYGRKAASIADFDYSAGLRKADIHWNDATLDRWLTEPGVMVPDTNMEFQVSDAAERKALIAYLKSLGNP